MIDQLHCLNCEADFTGTPEVMVFQFTEHDCFQQLIDEKQQSMCNHPTSRLKENTQWTH